MAANPIGLSPDRNAHRTLLIASQSRIKHCR
jgi:hypothetical protein